MRTEDSQIYLSTFSILGRLIVRLHVHWMVKKTRQICHSFVWESGWWEGGFLLGGKEEVRMGGMACGSTMIIHKCSADRYQHSNTRWHSDWADDVSFIHVVFLLPSSPYIIQSTSTSTVFSRYSYSLHLDSQRPPSFTRTCTRKSKQSTTTSIHAHCSTSLAPPDHVVTSPCTAHAQQQQQQQFSEWTP